MVDKPTTDRLMAEIKHLRQRVAELEAEQQVQGQQTHQELSERETMDLSRNLLVLQYAGATIAASLNLQDILDTFTDEIFSLLQVTGCAIYEWQPLAKTVSLLAQHSLPALPWWPALHTLPDLTGIPIFKTVLIDRRAQQIFSNSVEFDTQYQTYLDTNAIQTAFLLPMEFQDQVVGLIEIIDLNYHPFRHNEMALTQLLANQAASALYNARLYQKTRQQLQERARLEQELRQVAARNQAMLDAIPDSLIYLNRRGELLDYKIVDEDILPAILGKIDADYDLKQDLPLLLQAVREQLPQIFETGKMQILEHQANFPLGAQDFEVRLVRSSPKEALAIIRNVTRAKQAEQQASRTERLAALGQLSAALAHEINNPLQAIQGHLDLVLDYPIDDAEKGDHLQVVRQEIGRLAAIVRDILGYARPKQVTQQPTSLTGIIEHVLNLASRQLDPEVLKITLDMRPVPKVMAAPSQLTQVFLNLVLNAAEAMPESGQLHIAIYPEGETVATSFTNNGPTIPAHILPRIFDPFFTTKAHGSGLGLWLSHSMVEHHGGSLTVENLGREQGVVFTVKLPAQPNLKL